MPREILHQLSCFYIPKFEGWVLTGWHQVAGICWPSDLINWSHMASKCTHEFSWIPIPEFYRFIKWPWYEVAAIRGKLNMNDRLLMSCHLLDWLFLRQFEKLDCKVIWSSCQSFFMGFSCLFIKSKSYFLFAFCLIYNVFFFWIEASPLECVLCGKGHRIDPMTVAFHSSLKIALMIINTNFLVFRAADDLISTCPDNFRHTLCVVSEWSEAYSCQCIPHSNCKIFGACDEKI